MSHCVFLREHILKLRSRRHSAVDALHTLHSRHYRFAPVRGSPVPGTYPGSASIMDEMKAKHPERKQDILPLTTEQLGQLPTTLSKEELRTAILSMKRGKSTGPGGLSYEHLQALVITSTRTDLPLNAHDALDHLLAFANLILATTTLPPYFFSLFASIRLVASNKKDPRDLDDPADQDHRPIANGNCWRRMLGKACHTKFHDAFVDASGDEQFANGSPAGSSQLVFAILAYLAAHPEFAALKLDVKNAFQELIRALILEVYWETPSLRPLHSYMYHLLSTRAFVFLGSGSSMILCTFNSGEGSQQGCVFGMPNFNIVIAAVNRKTAALLRAHNGNLFAGADDTTLIGPPDVLYTIANDNHVPGLKTLGLEVAVHKSQTWIALEHRTPAYQELRGQIPQGSLPFTNEDVYQRRRHRIQRPWLHSMGGPNG
jgi:hypothetical protein